MSEPEYLPFAAGSLPVLLPMHFWHGTLQDRAGGEFQQSRSAVPVGEEVPWERFHELRVHATMPGVPRTTRTQRALARAAIRRDE
ncbi:hypothetical protein AQJ11_32615 [Streptomyces corchorusii]|uniref:Uncharacterized protein n=1 Tax=Streptomyces corchorusii TaxID=1903 RepID=A0A101PXH8_STRCK|nr:hypothetical protein AQJ11_32615 [Streptomyces corchorusii]